MVFAAVRTHFPRKTPACLVDRPAINKQLFKYYNEHNGIGSDRLVEWLERSPSIWAAGVRIHDEGKFSVHSLSFRFFLFLIIMYFFIK